MMESDFRKAVSAIRAHIRQYEEPAHEFQPGDVVRLWPGNYVGVVHSVDPIENEVTVFYMDGHQVKGPSYGYDLTHLDELGNEAK